MGDYFVPTCPECESNEDVGWDEDNEEWVCWKCEVVVQADPPKRWGIPDEEFNDMLGLS